MLSVLKFGLVSAMKLLYNNAVTNKRKEKHLKQEIKK